ncbi:hypothetical protein LP420_22995 [Massilia sp. B-10]|nr:hypothetical protein LP420_22995 [Massilia sp. B-10]
MLKIVLIVVIVLARRGGRRHATSVPSSGAGRRRSCVLKPRCRAVAMQAPQRVDFKELDHLPAPVQRYLRTVLKEGQPLVAGAGLRHTGSFNTGEEFAAWKPFSSEQQVTTRRPGFDWDGRIAMLPGLTVRVHDAYVAGEGRLHAAVLGLISVADLRDRGGLAEGELMRFLAEAAWYPTALLPSQGVHWEAIDARSARATLADGAVRVALVFRFNEQGLIDTVEAAARGRTVGKRIVPTPWQGRFWHYQERSQACWCRKTARSRGCCRTARAPTGAAT